MNRSSGNIRLSGKYREQLAENREEEVTIIKDGHDANYDRYHLVMGARFGKDILAPDGTPLGDRICDFTLSQRGALFAPVIGHSILSQGLFNSQIDAPFATYLANDRANLGSLAERMNIEGGFNGRIRVVPEGTIIFANEPFATVTGEFWRTQMLELLSQYAFDGPMTIANRAMRLRFAAGNNASISDFSPRRNWTAEKSLLVAIASYIGGLNDTSSVAASIKTGIPCVGTMAHFSVLAAIEYQIYREKMIGIANASGIVLDKHFEQKLFEMWLDANPKGTTLLVDTENTRNGVIRAILAAKSSQTRMDALKFIRIDSGDLAKDSLWAIKMLAANGLPHVGVIPTGNLTPERILEIRNVVEAAGCNIAGYGVGTWLSNPPPDEVAGVIFKLSHVNNIPVMKTSANKATLPGLVQVVRHKKNGINKFDVICLAGEPITPGPDCDEAIPLLQPFNPLYQSRSPDDLRNLVKQQLGQFDIPLEQYQRERVVLSPRLQRQKEITMKLMRDSNDYSGLVQMVEA